MRRTLDIYFFYIIRAIEITYFLIYHKQIISSTLQSRTPDGEALGDAFLDAKRSSAADYSVIY